MGEGVGGIGPGKPPGPRQIFLNPPPGPGRWTNGETTTMTHPGDAHLTLEQQATNFHTMRHIERVRNLIGGFILQLLLRGQEHDQTKLAPPEVQLFTEWTPRLAALTYGSPEYEEARRALGPALAHHYAHNRHHPEHHKNGVEDMTLIDLLEMLADWKAASERHNDGNILKSIEVNGGRFHLSPQLVRILENTAKAMGYL